MKKVTMEDLGELMWKMDNWYLRSGICLSSSSRSSFFELGHWIITFVKEAQGDIQDIMAEKEKYPDRKPNVPGYLKEKDLKILMDNVHELRTNLANDIGARRESIFSPRKRMLWAWFGRPDKVEGQNR